MKRSHILLAFAAAAIGLAAPAAPARAQENLKIVYEPPKNPKFAPIMAKLQQRKALEILQQFLSPLKFPLTLRTAECGAYYDTYKLGGPLTICYEYVDLIDSVQPGEKGPRAGDPSHQDMFKYLGRIGPVLITREMATVGPFVQHVLHEVSLAVFANMGVPVWGRLHDAADYAAAYLLLQFGTDVSRKTIYGTAYFLNQWDEVIREGHVDPATYMGDARATVRQRYYNLLCIAIGKDPIGFSTFVAFGRPESRIDLPAGRIASCRGSLDAERVPYGSDYDKVRRSFLKLVMPGLDQEKLKKVQNTKWIPD